MCILAVYASVSAVVCCAVSIFELLDRYPHSSSPGDVLENWPAVAYLLLNVVVGAMAVPLGRMTGLADWAEADLTGTGIVKAAIAGFGALGLLRSSVATLKDESQIGPAAFLDQLKLYLDRKIALRHKLKMEEQIVPLLDKVNAEALRIDIPSICVAGVQRFSKQEIEDLNSVISSTFQRPLSDAARKVIVGHLICELCGIDVLKSAIERHAGMASTGNDALRSQELLTELAEERARLLNEDSGGGGQK